MASTTPNYTQTLIPIFDGEGYEFWSIKMKTIFISQDLWGAIEEAFQEATPEEQSTWAAGRLKEYKQTMQKDAKALSLIQQGVSNAIFPRIMNAKTTKEAWEILKGQYKGSDKVITIKLQSLWKDFETLLMKEGESIRAFFSRVSNIVNQIRSNGDTIEDKKIVQKILRSLPAKFDHVVAAIEEAKDLTKLTLVELEGSLRAHEERMQKCEKPLEQAFHRRRGDRRCGLKMWRGAASFDGDAAGDEAGNVALGDEAGDEAGGADLGEWLNERREIERERVVRQNG
ncbi:putative RNA-directed DNA polymerase [Senna tora]|uniref:Putative RNA-directed DNA polymerase n=1 Tax=Senna tora TaxID=362788 RepID=A0A834T2M9_9FABA|nr:putative RNA-directed DNA polymerase [Senna tora]KAF7814438.1 putative RNA-directed DNA polymerase [Senna tora]